MSMINVVNTKLTVNTSTLGTTGLQCILGSFARPDGKATSKALWEDGRHA